MKRVFFLSFFLVCMCAFSMLSAQNRTFELYYFSQDPHFSESLRSTIDEIYQTAAYDENRTVYFYLAYADSPTILKCSSENEEEYEQFIETMQSQSMHPVWPATDVDRIIKLLDEDDFLSEDGTSKYDLFMLNFYVTSDFWTYKYNEGLVGRLFWDLGLDTMSRESFVVNMYRPEEDEFEYNDEKMFGRRNLPGDYPLYVLTY